MALYSCHDYIQVFLIYVHIYDLLSQVKGEKSFLHTSHKIPRLSNWPFDLNI